MQLPPLPLVDGTLFADNSAWVENLSTCDRKVQHQCLSLRVHTGEKAPLNFGSAMHLATELRYVRYGVKPVDAEFYEDLTPILTKFFEEHPVPAGDWRGLNWAMETTRRYNDRYYDEEFSLLEYQEPIVCPRCVGLPDFPPCLFCLGTRKRKVMVEMSFALKLYAHKCSKPYVDEKGKTWEFIDVYYSGRIDLPTAYVNVGIYTTDTKTTGHLGDTFWFEQKMSNQHRGYCWAFKEITGVEPVGFQINAIRSKEPPQYVLNNGLSRKGTKQTPAEWWRESLCRQKHHLRLGDLSYWKDNVITLFEEFFWNYERGYLPMKTKWCASYGKCPYLDVCEMPREDQNSMLQSGMYTANIWSPLSDPTQSLQ